MPLTFRIADELCPCAGQPWHSSEANQRLSGSIDLTQIPHDLQFWSSLFALTPFFSKKKKYSTVLQTDTERLDLKTGVIYTTRSELAAVKLFLIYLKALIIEVIDLD